MTDMPLYLVVLPPGKDDWETLDALISKRQKSLGIQIKRYLILQPHPRRDSGCFREAPAILQTFQKRARRALVVFDHEGSGQEAREAEDVVADLLKRLADSGWDDRAEVLLLQPELEVWIWSDSPHLDMALGWVGRQPSLRDWLQIRGWWPAGVAKPPRPKESLLVALREAGIRRSAAVYRRLAENAGLERCQDQSFLKFKDLMRSWFPENKGSND